MADENRKKDQDHGKIFEESFGFSEQEILADIEKAEKTADAPEFEGAEERIYRRLMERKAEEEKKQSRRPVRLKKKKAALLVAFAAVFVLMLGITAIGGKNYFFRIRTIEKGIVLNNDKVIMEQEKLEEAYAQAKGKIGDSVLKLGYIPENMVFDKLILSQNRVAFRFKLDDEVIYFIQQHGKLSTSINIESDRNESEEIIYNRWINQDIQLKMEKPDDRDGLSASFLVDESSYYFVGKLEFEEIKKIIENLNFY